MCAGAGVPRSCVYELKSGRNKGISRKNAEKIASFFDITVDELYSSKQKEKPPLTDDEFDLILSMRDLTVKELEQVKSYVSFVKSQRKQ